MNEAAQLLVDFMDRGGMGPGASQANGGRINTNYKNDSVTLPSMFQGLQSTFVAAAQSQLQPQPQQQQYSYQSSAYQPRVTHTPTTRTEFQTRFIEELDGDPLRDESVARILEKVFGNHDVADWLQARTSPADLASSSFNAKESIASACLISSNSDTARNISSRFGNAYDNPVQEARKVEDLLNENQVIPECVVSTNVFFNHFSTPNYAFMTVQDYSSPLVFMEHATKPKPGFHRGVVDISSKEILCLYLYYWCENGQSVLSYYSFDIQRHGEIDGFNILFMPYPDSRYPTVKDIKHLTVSIKTKDCHYCVFRNTPCQCPFEMAAKSHVIHPQPNFLLHSDGWEAWKWTLRKTSGLLSHQHVIEKDSGTNQVTRKESFSFVVVNAEGSAPPKPSNFMELPGVPLFPNTMQRSASWQALAPQAPMQHQTPTPISHPHFSANDLYFRPMNSMPIVSSNQPHGSHGSNGSYGVPLPSLSPLYSHQQQQQFMLPQSLYNSAPLNLSPYSAFLKASPAQTDAVVFRQQENENQSNSHGQVPRSASNSPNTGSNQSRKRHHVETILTGTFDSGMKRSRSDHPGPAMMTVSLTPTAMAGAAGNIAVPASAIIAAMRCNPNASPKTGGDSSKPVPLAATLQCHRCTSVFARKHDLKRHIRTRHERQRNFQCEVCKKKFLLKWHLKAHMSTIHEKNKSFACEHCQASFGTSSNWRKHLRNVHNIGGETGQVAGGLNTKEEASTSGRIGESTYGMCITLEVRPAKSLVA
eukprot:CAMPEP_0184706956 /NCGR_PEP_ID=MMETSP0313-20130426/37024_1 /TAXON_ID=2792 /ORGANISM="Porphyridium aerugineum, Strain SAG 1380-2" /LENGTH=758 /DNA_ID=CAMNT_0027168525 /DNA_START=777 /DNA_END=3053 /DNA_ORIENTATION=+